MEEVRIEDLERRLRWYYFNMIALGGCLGVMILSSVYLQYIGRSFLFILVCCCSGVVGIRLTAMRDKIDLVNKILNQETPFDDTTSVYEIDNDGNVIPL